GGHLADLRLAHGRPRWMPCTAPCTGAPPFEVRPMTLFDSATEPGCAGGVGMLFGAPTPALLIGLAIGLVPGDWRPAKKPGAPIGPGVTCVTLAASITSWAKIGWLRRMSSARRSVITSSAFSM